MKKNITEQDTKPKTIDLKHARDVVKCPFLVGAIFGQGVMKKIATSDSKFGNYKTGDELYIKNNWTYDVVRGDELIKENLPWKCDSYVETAGKDQNISNLTPDQQTKINTMITDQAWSKTKPADYDTYPNNYITFTEIPGVVLYKQKSLKNTSPSQLEIINVFLTEKGYTLKQPNFGTEEYNYSVKNPMTLADLISPEEAKNLGVSDLTTKIYPTENILGKDRTGPQTKKEYKDTLKKVEESPRYSSKQCQDNIELLYFNSPLMTKKPRNFTPLEDNVKIQETKNVVLACIAQQGLEGFTQMRGYRRNTDTQVRSLITMSGKFGMKDEYKIYKKQLRGESFSNDLKQLVHENLIQHSIDKKNKLIKEQKVVKTRFSLLKEGLNIKTKKDRIIFSNRLMSEMVYLETQGYDQQIISEGLFDIIQGIFGNAGEGIVQMIKQKMADWFINKLSPDLQKTWVAGIIVNVFTDTNLMDIPKLLKCDFLTKKLAEAIIEEIPKQIQYKTGKTDWFYDTLRNSMLETLEESNFGQNLEKGLVSVVCPMIENIKGKFSGIESKIKSQALGLEAK